MISFCLNETATDVSIVYGSNAATNDLGSLTKGFHNFSLAYNSTNYTTYSIVVYNVGNGQVTETSSDSNPLNTETGVVYSTGNMNSVAVNTSPADHNFGRIYMGIRYGVGFFCRNADQSDCLGQSTNNPSQAGLGAFLNEGLSSFDPTRIYVAPDDSLYVGASTTLSGGYWLAALTPDLTSYQFVVSPTNVYNGGFIGTPIAYGSIAQGNLVVYCMNYAYGPGQSLYQWNIGSGPLPADSLQPTLLANSTEGVVQNWCDGFPAPNGTNFYTFLDRSSHTSPQFGGSLSVFNQAGGSTAIWQSLNNSITSGYDYFANMSDVKMAPNGQYLVGIDNATGYLVFCNVDSNGIPIETTLFTNVVGTPTSASTYGEVAFDAAGNIYEGWNGNGILKVFSPGQTTLAITANDTTTTNGTFSLTYPTASISVSATIPVASQNTSPNNTGAGPAIPGQFTITRTGGLLGQPLTVYFMLEGTASNAVYTATAGASTFISTNGAGHYVTNSITLAAGQTSTNITITPVIDGVPRLTTTVTLNTVTNVNYSAPIGGAPVVDIVNTGPQALEITGVGTLVNGTPTPSMYKGLTNDYASFVITRLGDTNNGASYTVTNFTYSGAATVNVDFTPPAYTVVSPSPYQYNASTELLTLGGGVTISPGMVSVIATISPLQTTSTYQGNKTVTIGIGAGANYTVATTNTVTLTLIDNADPVSTVLFADPLTNTVDVNNNDGIAIWNILFANTNFPCVPDYTAAFGYTLANDNVGPPPNGATTALKVVVNRNGNGAAAGINLYPTNFTFSGNYAMRFNMLLLEGEDYPVNFAMFGIDYSGLATNWVPFVDTASPGQTTYPWGMDGITYLVDAQFNGTSLGDYLSVTGEGLGSQYGYIPLAEGAAGSGTPGAQNQGGRSGLSYAASFKNSFDYPPGPYNAYPYEGYYVSGVPSDSVNGGLLDNNTPANTWADVEVKQINNVVTFSINKTVILSYTNTTTYTSGTGPFTNNQSGTIMLGYNDPYNSISSADNAVYFSNLRVVRLAPIEITSMALTGGNVLINFTSTDGDDTTSSFTLLSGTNAAAVNTAVAGASFSQITSGQSAGTFLVTTPKPASGVEFYRIKHN